MPYEETSTQEPFFSNIDLSFDPFDHEVLDFELFGNERKHEGDELLDDVSCSSTDWPIEDIPNDMPLTFTTNDSDNGLKQLREDFKIFHRNLSNYPIQQAKLLLSRRLKEIKAEIIANPLFKTQLDDYSSKKKLKSSGIIKQNRQLIHQLYGESKKSTLVDELPNGSIQDNTSLYLSEYDTHKNSTWDNLQQYLKTIQNDPDREAKLKKYLFENRVAIEADPKTRAKLNEFTRKNQKQKSIIFGDGFSLEDILHEGIATTDPEIERILDSELPNESTQDSKPTGYDNNGIDEMERIRKNLKKYLIKIKSHPDRKTKLDKYHKKIKKRIQKNPALQAQLDAYRRKKGESDEKVVASSLPIPAFMSPINSKKRRRTADKKEAPKKPRKSDKKIIQSKIK